VPKVKKLTEDELWACLRSLIGKTIWTLVKGNSNRIVAVTDIGVIFDGRVSIPTRRQITWAYEKLWRTGQLGLAEPLKRRRVSAITLALLKGAVPEQVEQVVENSGRKVARLRLARGSPEGYVQASQREV
jgi:hypothetical protein